MCGQCPHAAPLHHQRTEETRQQGPHRLRSVPLVRIIPGHSTFEPRSLQRCRSHPGDTMHVFTSPHEDSDSRTQESPRNPEDSQKHNPGRLIFSPPLLSQDAARLWTCVCVAPSNTAAARGKCGTSTTDVDFPTFGVRGSFTAPWCGQQTAAHTQQSPEPYNMQQTSQRAAVANKCQHSSAQREA